MGDINGFKSVFGELKQVNLEEKIMEFRNEKVEQVTHTKGRPDKWSKEDTYNIKVECYPGTDERYGNRYSGFFKDSVISKLFGGLSEGDFAGKDVKIGFEWREYEKDGQTKKARELKSITMRDIDVNDDIRPEDSENPLFDPPVESEHPALEPEAPNKPLSTEKLGEGRGNGTLAAQMSLKDVSIVRQVCWKVSGGIIKSLNLGENVEENIEIAVKLAHSIEEDINR